jgi:hypothetical protein
MFISKKQIMTACRPPASMFPLIAHDFHSGMKGFIGKSEDIGIAQIRCCFSVSDFPAGGLFKAQV